MCGQLVPVNEDVLPPWLPNRLHSSKLVECPELVIRQRSSLKYEGYGFGRFDGFPGDLNRYGQDSQRKFYNVFLLHVTSSQQWSSALILSKK